MARRSPISRVRSVTDTSMMFMIPTPPTISEIAATPDSSHDMVVVVEVSTAAISSGDRIVKSSASRGCRRWRWRSSAAMSSETADAAREPSRPTVTFDR